MKKNILLCVAGGTPQIITETLFALTQVQKVRIDEIRVITTLEGRDRIVEGLFGEAGKIAEFFDDFGITPDSLKFDETCVSLLRTADGQMLRDIRTPAENVLAGDQICEFVSELARDKNSVIFASAAGGRKTMSIYLTAAMQLFGRAEDSLSHVLVNEDFEGHPQFYYPPKTPKTLKTRDGREVSTKDSQVYLAPIPFIRLRGIGVKVFDDSIRTYQKAVRKAQADLKFLESASRLKLDFRKMTLRTADRTVRLTQREFFVYVMFAYFRTRNIGEDGFVGLDEVTRRDLNAVCRLFVKPDDGEEPIDCFYAEMKRANFINNFVFEYVGADLIEKKQEKLRRKGLAANRVEVSREETARKIMNTYREIFDKISPKLAAQKMEKFDITRRGDRGGHIFGLEIERDKIEGLDDLPV